VNDDSGATDAFQNQSQPPLLFIVHRKFVFPVPDIFRLRDVDNVLCDALDQIDNLLQTPRHWRWFPKAFDLVLPYNTLGS
jgi:hypothetical protein